MQGQATLTKVVKASATAIKAVPTDRLIGIPYWPAIQNPRDI